MLERPVNLLLLTSGEAWCNSLVILLAGLAVAPGPAIPGAVTAPTLALAFALAFFFANAPAGGAVSTVICLLGIGVIRRPMFLFTTVAACALEGRRRRSTARLRWHCR